MLFLNHQDFRTSLQLSFQAAYDVKKQTTGMF